MNYNTVGAVIPPTVTKVGFVAQDRVRLLTERNQYRDTNVHLCMQLNKCKALVDRYERQLADENNPTYQFQVELLEAQLHQQRVHSIVVVGVLLTVIIALFAGYLICPEYLPSMSKAYLSFQSGNDLLMNELQWSEVSKK